MKSFYVFIEYCKNYTFILNSTQTVEKMRAICYNFNCDSICVFLYGFYTMKILKSLFFLCIVLGDYQFVLGMDAPRKMRPLKADKKILTQEQLDIQNQYKLIGDQKRNQECSAKITNTLKRCSDNDYDALEYHDIENISKDFNAMKDYTPSKTKRTIADFLMNQAVSDIVDDDLDQVAKNNQTLTDLQSSSVKKARILSIVVDTIASPITKQRAALTFHYNQDQSLRGISGGHAYEAYEGHDLFSHDKDLFVGADYQTIGMSFGQDISKTVRIGLTENLIIEDFKNSITVASSPDNKKFRISKTLNNNYVGSYQDKDNPLIYATQFPVLVISSKQIDQDGKIYVGQFIKASQIRSLNQKNTDYFDNHEFYITHDDLVHIINESRLFDSRVNDVVFADVTDKLNGYFKADLDNLGMTGFPVPIYGMLDNSK